MADTGSGILGYLNPDLLAAQRRQALAQMLLEKGSQAPDQKNPYSGLTDAGNMLLGAYLLKKSDQDMSSAYGSMFNGGGPSQNAPPSQPAPPTQAMAPGGDMFAMPNSSAPMAPVPGSAPAPAQSFSPSGQNAPPQQGGGQAPQAMSGMSGYLDQVIPQMPGMPPMSLIERFQIANNPDQYKVDLDNYMKYYQPTDAMKQVASSLEGGFSNPHFAEKMAALNAKAAQMSPIAPGDVVPDPSKDPSQWMATPGRTGYTPKYNAANGQWEISLPPGSAAALATGEGAKKFGTAIATPAPRIVTKGPNAGSYVAGSDAQNLPPGTANQFGMNVPPPDPNTAPVAPLGSGAGAGAQSTGAVGRSQSYQANANAAPLLDNILVSMQDIVNRGLKPGMPEWANDMQRIVPAFKTLMGDKGSINPNDPAVLQDVFDKLSNQFQLNQAGNINGQSTDALRATIHAASPNDTHLGPALNQIIPWLRANNLANKAQNNFMRATGIDPAVDPNGYKPQRRIGQIPTRLALHSSR